MAGKSRVEEGLREMGKRIGKNNMKTLSESFAYKEEQRHGLMVDRDVGSREGCFSFLFKEGKGCSSQNKGLAERYMAVHMGFLCSTRRDLKGC